MASDTNNSGIYVIEGPARGQSIAVSGDSVTAFVGPAPRGPVDHAVTIENPEDFQKVFGAYLMDFSFLHPTSFFILQGTYECHWGPYDSLS